MSTDRKLELRLRAPGPDHGLLRRNKRNMNPEIDGLSDHEKVEILTHWFREKLVGALNDIPSLLGSRTNDASSNLTLRLEFDKGTFRSQHVEITSSFEDIYSRAIVESARNGEKAEE